MMEKPEGFKYTIPMSEWPQEWKDYRWYCRTVNTHPEWKDLTLEEVKEKSKESKANRGRNNIAKWHESYQDLPEEEKERINRSKGNGWKNLTEEERAEKSRHMQEISQNFWDGMSEEERAAFVASRENGLTEQQKANRKIAGTNNLITYNNALTYEEKRESGSRLAEYSHTVYHTDPEYRERQLKQLAEAREIYNDSLTPERRAEIGKYVRFRWDQSSDEYKQKVSENTTKRNQEWWANRTPEERQAISERMTKFNDDLWNNMPMERFIDIHRKRLVNSTSERNSLTDKFEKMFHNSVASKDFYLVPQTEYHVDRDVHFWDYGVYSKSDNRLVMVVDVDGAYNHADKCDYNGLHSREEADEKRFYLSPPDVKIAIIYEARLTNSFDKMLRELMMNYDEFVESQFKYCRSINFPYPRYSTDELLESWKSLVKMNCNDEYHQNMSLNTRVGDRLINHFHPSIYHARRGNNPSPYDAWYDDLLLKKVIENRMIYVNELNPNKILQGFNVCKLAPKVSVFSAAKAKMLVNKYLSDATEIFDPFSGFSGRMLGTVALGKKYFGIDISDTHASESNELIHFLKTHGVHIDATVLEWDVMKATGSYDALFTCPPYGTKEVWEKPNGEQPSCDEWIDVCLNRFNCKKYLFVVDKTEKYKDHIVDEIVNRSHLGTNTEYVVLIERP